jgi:hypothetical protein
LTALFLTSAVQAGIITSVNSGGSFADLSEGFSCSDAGTATASCGVDDYLDVFHNASGSYQANAQYGRLDAIATSSIYDYAGGSMVGTSTAGFSDTLVITGGTGSGTLIFAAEYWGSIMGEGCATGSCLENSTIALNTFTTHPYSSTPTLVNLSFSFTFGSPFGLNAMASAYTSVSVAESAMQTSHLKVDAIEVHDATGALTTDYTVTSASGAVLPFVTPEPATLSFVIVAVIALPFVRRLSADKRG